MRVVRDSDNVARDSDNVARDSDNVARDSDNVARDSDNVARDSNTATPVQRKVARTLCQAACDGSSLERDSSKVGWHGFAPGSRTHPSS